MKNDINKRDAVILEIKRLETAKRRSRSKYLKSDYDKAIKKLRKSIIIYDFYKGSN